MAPVLSLLRWAFFLGLAAWVQTSDAAKPNLTLARPSAMLCSSDEPARVFYGTSVGEIAAIKMDGGYAQWQNKDHEDRSGIKILKTFGGRLVGASVGGTVHVLDAHTGKTQWEHNHNDRVLDVFSHGPDKSFNTIVVHESGVQSRSFAGDHKWGVFPAALGTPSARFVAATMSEDMTSLCAIANNTDAGPALFAVTIDAKTGKVQQQEQLPEVMAAAVGSNYIVVGQHLAYTEKDTLSVYPICGSGVADTFSLKSMRVKPHLVGSTRFLPWLQTRSVFGMTNNASTYIFRITEEELKLVRTEPATGAVGIIQDTFASVSKSEDHVAVALKKPNATDGTGFYDVKFINVITGETERERGIRELDANQHGPPSWVAACGHSKDLHINIAAEDHTLVSVKGIKPAWTLEAGHVDVKRRQNEHPFFKSGHHEVLHHGGEL